MKQHGTYRDLTNLERDIKYQCSISPVFQVFNREKIKRFYQENTGRLSYISKTVSALMEEHIIKDEKGIFQQHVKPEGMDNGWKYKTEEDEKKFAEAMESVMTKSIEIYL